MLLFYTPDIISDVYILNEEESKHIIRVLRLVSGDKISLTDGRGTLFHATITDDHPKRCSVKIDETIREYGKRDFRLHIVVAPTKNIARMEWFLEKATEIGIDEITPVWCEHSERQVVKTERLNRIITSAIKQSLKTYHPLLHEPATLREFLKQDISADKFIGYCDLENPPLLKNLCKKGNNTVIIIGPEGDFSPEEIFAAQKAGFVPVSFGKSRLRTETAALVACTTINLINES